MTSPGGTAPRPRRVTGPADAFVVAARRSPIGRVGGALRTVQAEHLAAPVLRAVLADAQVDPGEVDEVVLGNAWGPGGNPARVAALAAGFGARVPALTVDRQCASGLEAVNLAARLVASGAAGVCLAGGVESISTAPWRVAKPPSLYATPSFTGRARFAPGDADACDPDMGPAADALAREHGVGRERQDRFALASHRKAVTAAAQGRFDGEIVALPASDRAAATGAPVDPAHAVGADQCPRARLTLESLGRFPPVFTPGGTVTAGNTAPGGDGAAAVVVVSPSVYERLGRPPALRVAATAAAGVDARLPGLGPVAAVTALLDAHPDVTLGDIGVVELTEAFAGQALACLDALGIPDERVSPGGGAIALGHPWGASGAVLLVRLYTEMVRRAPARAPRYGLATVAAAGGLGVATLVERAG